NASRPSLHSHHFIQTPPHHVSIFTTSSKPRRTTSPFSPRHPNPSGRRRYFHHVIQTPPDDVAIFTTSSKPLRTTSSFSPRHPNSKKAKTPFEFWLSSSFS